MPLKIEGEFGQEPIKVKRLNHCYTFVSECPKCRTEARSQHYLSHPHSNQVERFWFECSADADVECPDCRGQGCVECDDGTRVGLCGREWSEKFVLEIRARTVIGAKGGSFDNQQPCTLCGEGGKGKRTVWDVEKEFLKATGVYVCAACLRGKANDCDGFDMSGLGSDIPDPVDPTAGELAGEFAQSCRDLAASDPFVKTQLELVESALDMLFFVCSKNESAEQSLAGGIALAVVSWKTSKICGVHVANCLQHIQKSIGDSP